MAHVYDTDIIMLKINYLYHTILLQRLLSFHLVVSFCIPSTFSLQYIAWDISSSPMFVE
jgi:hypothetical protein